MDKCEMCQKEVKDKIRDFSKDKYNKILCWDCQQKQKPEVKQESKPTTKNTDEDKQSMKVQGLMKIGATIYTAFDKEERKVKSFEGIMNSVVKEYKRLLKEDI